MDQIAFLPIAPEVVLLVAALLVLLTEVGLSLGRRIWGVVVAAALVLSFGFSVLQWLRVDELGPQLNFTGPRRPHRHQPDGRDGPLLGDGRLRPLRRRRPGADRRLEAGGGAGHPRRRVRGAGAPRRGRAPPDGDLVEPDPDVHRAGDGIDQPVRRRRVHQGAGALRRGGDEVLPARGRRPRRSSSTGSPSPSPPPGRPPSTGSGGSPRSSRRPSCSSRRSPWSPSGCWWSGSGSRCRRPRSTSGPRTSTRGRRRRRCR